MKRPPLPEDLAERVDDGTSVCTLGIPAAVETEMGDSQ